VADSGPNMVSATNKLHEKVQKVPCVAHRLNLAVNDLLKVKKIKEKLGTGNGSSINFLVVFCVENIIKIFFT
jgi:hypothetical protein